MSLEKSYLSLWAESLGLDREDLLTPTMTLSTKGSYVLRHPDKVFYFKDFCTGKTVLAAEAKKIQEAARRIDAANVLKSKFPSPPLFNDWDYYLDRKSDLKIPTSSHSISEINRGMPELKDFLEACSEGDIDTLDLASDDDFAFGIFDGNVLAAVSRYAPIRKTGFADITVLARPDHRRKGLSGPLVAELVKRIFADGFLPRYRVASDIYASIAIAERLGFYRKTQIITWDF